MAVKRQKRIERLIAELEEIIDATAKLEERYAEALARVHPAHQRSARNLVHYLALRRHDLGRLQRRLADFGLSRLGQARGHVQADLLMSRSLLQSFLRPKRLKTKQAVVTAKQARKLTSRKTKALLGYRSKGRRVRIMVTLPSEAAEDDRLVRDLLAAGMNSVRINCAHDTPARWKRMIDNVRRASEKERRRCHVLMDLGGPKIRTGPVEAGPREVRIRPPRTGPGGSREAARVWLAPHADPPPAPAAAHLPVPADWLARVRTGDAVHLVDARGKERVLRIDRAAGPGRWALCECRTHVAAGTPLRLENESETARVGDLPARERHIALVPGDRLDLHREARPGQPAVGPGGADPRVAHISLSEPRVFDRVQAGERILFDDGKISGVVRDVSADRLRVEITQARRGRAKLRADRGVNLPDSDLRIGALTAADREHLPFVARHADMVGLSFVNGPEDVKALLEEIERLGAGEELGVVLKIETQRGFDNLASILLEAMRTHPIGVMIARGDLAVECGWENMAWIQEEILSLCEAAHAPDIWATQVLESLAKKGLPSRAEITDAATAERAQCVMLNKGPHILSAIRMLDHILKRTRAYREGPGDRWASAGS